MALANSHQGGRESAVKYTPPIFESTMKMPVSVTPRKILIAFASLTIVTLVFVGIAWLAPRLLGLYYQVQGGMQLREVLRAAGVEEDIACTNDAFTDEVSVRKLESAIENLKKATGYFPELAQAHLLLGRANCALGEYEKTVGAYNEYLRLRPKSPIGHLEAGFGYFNALTLSCKYKNCSDLSRYTKTISQQFIYSVKDTDDVVELLLKRYEKNIQIRSLLYLVIGQINNEQSKGRKFYQYLVAAVSGSEDQLISLQQQTGFPLYHFSSDIFRINAGDLLLSDFFHAGEFVRSYSPEDYNVLWWNTTATAIVCFPDKGLYEISVSVQDRDPAPLRVQLEHNLYPFAFFVLDKADNSWEILKGNFSNEPGCQVIGISFLNNGVVDGKDRNLMIQWLEIRRVE